MAISQTSILRGITNADLKKTVRRALERGFTLGEMTGTTHCYVVWPPTGERVGFGTTVSDRNYWKGFARQCETVSGVTIIERSKSGKSRHKTMRDGYSTTFRPSTADQLAARVEEINKEYRERALEFRILSMGGEGASTYDQINQAAKCIERLAQLERTLKELHQPLPDVDGMRPITHMTIKEINDRDI